MNRFIIFSLLCLFNSACITNSQVPSTSLEGLYVREGGSEFFKLYPKGEAKFISQVHGMYPPIASELNANYTFHDGMLKLNVKRRDGGLLKFKMTYNSDGDYYIEKRSFSPYRKISYAKIGDKVYK